MQNKRVAIIGGGAGGLAAAKSARECGLEPTVYERESSAGGIWRETASYTWEGMRANGSFQIVSFSDFHWQDDAPDFPNRRDLCEYLHKYIEAFDLGRCIRFNDGVEKVERVENGWRVTAEASGSEVYDYVIVANGANNEKRFPDITGLEDFPGTVIHSSEFQTPEHFPDQTVLVIGNAFSGADICSDLVRGGARRVVSAVRRPLWFVKRYLASGIPYDWVFTRRTGSFPDYGEVTKKKVHETLARWAGKNPGDVCEALRVDPEKDLPYLSITDDYLDRVAKGEIQVRKGLARFEGNEAVFDGGERIKVDAVLCATGYRMSLPFFDQSILNQLDTDYTDVFQPFILNKSTFHPALPNLAFVGVFRGALFATIELQARWACMVFGGQVPPPTEKEMEEGMHEEWNYRNSTHRTQLRYNDKFDDAIAKIIGVYPEADLNGDGKGSGDGELAKWLWEGPLLAAHYRLCGPNADRKAAIKLIREINEKVEKSKVET